MKTAIELLTSKREVLRQELARNTILVDYYESERDKNLGYADSYIKRARADKETAQQYCEARTMVQVQLNEIDASIAKLEQP